MNWGREENLTYHTYIYLDVNVSFSTQMITWESLTQKVMMENFLDTQKHLRHSKFTTQEP